MNEIAEPSRHGHRASKARDGVTRVLSSCFQSLTNRLGRARFNTIISRLSKGIQPPYNMIEVMLIAPIFANITKLWVGGIIKSFFNIIIPKDRFSEYSYNPKTLFMMSPRQF